MCFSHFDQGCWQILALRGIMKDVDELVLATLNVRLGGRLYF
jgi:hypothetical protein